MGADSIVSIVLCSVAAGATLLSTCASPKEDEKAAVVGNQTVAEERVQQKEYRQTTTAQPVTAQPTDQSGFKPVSQQPPQTGQSGVKVGVNTNPQVNTQQTSTPKQEQPVKQELPSF